MSTVERLDAYVSLGTKQGLSVWGNRTTWQSLFGYVPHFVEQLNTHRSVLEFLGGTFRDKKNGKLINPPQVFFSHQLEQLRSSQAELNQSSQELKQVVSHLTSLLQNERNKRHEIEQQFEQQIADLKAKLAQAVTGQLSSSDFQQLSRHEQRTAAELAAEAVIANQAKLHAKAELNQRLEAHDASAAYPPSKKDLEELRAKYEDFNSVAKTLTRQFKPQYEEPAANEPSAVESRDTTAVGQLLDEHISKAEEYLKLLNRDENKESKKDLFAGEAALEPQGTSLLLRSGEQFQETAATSRADQGFNLPSLLSYASQISSSGGQLDFNTLTSLQNLQNQLPPGQLNSLLQQQSSWKLGSSSQQAGLQSGMKRPREDDKPPG